MPLAARVLDPVTHPIPPVLTGGPGSPDVMIGGQPAWRALPASVGAALDSLSNAMNSFMTTPVLTPASAASQIAQISQSMTKLGAEAAAAGSPGTSTAASSGLTAVTTTNTALTTAWTTASAAPGGQPAANVAYTEGIKAAMAAAATATLSSMAGVADMHTCGTPVPIPPHGPGFVTKGASDVFVNGLPLARQSDKVMEAAGGANPISMGCPTVNVGDSGGSGGGGGGGGGAGAAVSSFAPGAAGADDSSPLVDTARAAVGSTEWAYDANRTPYPPNTNKCNLFVFEMANAAGQRVPMQERWSWRNLGYVEYPPLAGQWADPTYNIPGWEVVSDPKPGDVAAIATNYSDATGHVAIVSGPGTTISANSEQIVENNWGFRPGQKPTFRRYTGRQ